MKSLWGQEMSEALVAIENLSVTRRMISLMSEDKNPTLKIVLPNGVSCIKFKSSKEEFNKLCSEEGCVTINLVGKCENNEYFNHTIPQIIVSDYEIVNRQQYYF